MSWQDITLIQKFNLHEAFTGSKTDLFSGLVRMLIQLRCWRHEAKSELTLPVLLDSPLLTAAWWGDHTPWWQSMSLLLPARPMRHHLYIKNVSTETSSQACLFCLMTIAVALETGSYPLHATIIHQIWRVFFFLKTQVVSTCLKGVLKFSLFKHPESYFFGSTTVKGGCC